MIKCTIAALKGAVLGLMSVAAMAGYIALGIWISKRVGLSYENEGFAMLVYVSTTFGAALGALYCKAQQRPS